MMPEHVPLAMNDRNFLPALPFESWKNTFETLHMWAQMVGKVRLTLCPLVNHWWNVTFYVTGRGMSTLMMPYQDRGVEIRFDFIDHRLIIETTDGGRRVLDLKPQSVAQFYRAFTAALAELGVNVKIWSMPVEIPDPIPFDRDLTHASYDAAAVHRFWLILAWVDEVFQEFRARFIGKVSPVHFWWGSFDLAVTRFSGRPAPERPGADRVTREAYSHEVSSAGFWPGGGEIKGPAFYSYAAPEFAGFAQQRVGPAAAFYHPEMKEFLLMYDDVRTAASPKAELMDFLQSTYEAAATLAKWDRKALER
ncbi:MAG: DUF5996 family protein [Candidatus Korobacteraceae bacterium]